VVPANGGDFASRGPADAEFVSRPPLSVFAFYRDHPPRREALRSAPPGSGERYWLFGLDQLAARGARVAHNLEPERAPSWLDRRAAAAVNRALGRVGGYGGDFATVFACRRGANAADVIFSTVDTVGIPLVLARRARLVSRPVVYVSVGLLNRIARLRGDRVRALYRSAFLRVDTIVAYSLAEVEALRRWLSSEDGGPRLVFLPFGVDTEYFRPRPDREPDADVVSIGADLRRDFALVVHLAERHPELSVRIVTSNQHARSLGPVPGNVTVEVDVPFPSVRDRLTGARVVLLPVKENVHSGATTVLLQAMAAGKPVVVTRTQAIASGYHLAHGQNCLLVEPGDAEGHEAATLGLLDDPERAAALGARARETVERHLAWERYVDGLWQVLASATARARLR